MMELHDPKIHMGQITAGEARDLYAANPVILLPMGSHEDQGPHGPMGDYLLAEKVAELIAIKATANGTRTVVAPVLPFGGADFFGPMIGGIAVRSETLIAIITDMIASLHRTGLTRIIVINGHAGNVGPIDEVTRLIYREQRMVIPSLYLWRIAYGLLPGLIGAEQAAKVSGHGADPLTSLGLHLMPELQRPDLVPTAADLKRDPQFDLPFTTLGLASFDGMDVGMPHEYDEIFNDGVDKGDPNLSSAETGQVLTDKLVDVVSRFIAHFADETPSSQT
jgi:creatinine amidohydrolase